MVYKPTLEAPNIQGHPAAQDPFNEARRLSLDPIYRGRCVVLLRDTPELPQQVDQDYVFSCHAPDLARQIYRELGAGAKVRLLARAGRVMQWDVASAARQVVIPSCDEHEGMPWNKSLVRLWWRCPVCGGPRGHVFASLSYDGSRRFEVHAWRNSCGHVDYYDAVRTEAAANGLNEAVAK